MTLSPLLGASVFVQVHAFAAMAAFCLGLIQLTAPKGTVSHRFVGWFWVALMAMVAASSFGIHDIRQLGPFSLIHLLSVYTLATLPLAVLAARRHKVAAHKKSMIGIFVGALVIAGALTFTPSRVMYRVLVGG